MNSRSVLHVNSSAELAEFMEAVAEILRRIQTDYKLTLLEIADRIDVSLGTISNAANKKSALSATYLNRLGKEFGPHMLDPYAALTGARMVPLEADESADPLPSTAAAVHSLALVQSPHSPGGQQITHRELLQIEPEIDAAIRALTQLKIRCGQVRAA